MSAPISPTSPSIALPDNKKPKKKKRWPWVVAAVVIVVAAGGGVAAYVATHSEKLTGPDLTQSYPVTYEVTGDVKNGLVSYTVGDNDAETANTVANGWMKQTEVVGTIGGYIVATNGPHDEGSIGCKIAVGESILVEQTASGKGASVTCTAEGKAIAEAQPTPEK